MSSTAGRAIARGYRRAASPAAARWTSRSAPNPIVAGPAPPRHPRSTDHLLFAVISEPPDDPIWLDITLFAQMLREETDDDVVHLLRFGLVWVHVERVRQPLPHVKLGIDAFRHQPRDRKRQSMNSIHYC